MINMPTSLMLCCLQETQNAGPVLVDQSSPRRDPLLASDVKPESTVQLPPSVKNATKVLKYNFQLSSFLIEQKALVWLT